MHVSSPTDPIAELYSQHNGWLNSWLRKKTGCPHNAADLAHDTFVRLIKARDKVEIEEPRAYLTTIARSLMINQFRRREIEQAWLDTLAHADEALPGACDGTLPALQGLTHGCQSRPSA